VNGAIAYTNRARATWASVTTNGDSPQGPVSARSAPNGLRPSQQPIGAPIGGGVSQSAAGMRPSQIPVASSGVSATVPPSGASGAAWDFSKIPIFPLDRASWSHDGSDISFSINASTDTSERDAHVRFSTCRIAQSVDSPTICRQDYDAPIATTAVNAAAPSPTQQMPLLYGLPTPFFGGPITFAPWAVGAQQDPGIAVFSPKFVVLGSVIADSSVSIADYEIGFMQAIVASQMTAIYVDNNGHPQQTLTIGEQSLPLRDSESGSKPWSKQQDVKSLNQQDEGYSR
jgi:hypothetical protein